MAKAMGNHYARPVIGWADDVERLGRREVDDFFKRYYGPQSLTVSIVGDVDPSKVRGMKKVVYFNFNVVPCTAPVCARGASLQKAQAHGGSSCGVAL